MIFKYKTECTGGCLSIFCNYYKVYATYSVKWMVKERDSFVKWDESARECDKSNWSPTFQSVFLKSSFNFLHSVYGLDEFNKLFLISQQALSFFIKLLCPPYTHKQLLHRVGHRTTDRCYRKQTRKCTYKKTNMAILSGVMNRAPTLFSSCLRTCKPCCQLDGVSNLRIS